MLLSDSLKTYTTALGQLSNQAFQARLVIADAGVEQALKGITDEINKFFQSAQGKQFLEQVGAALGKLLGILGEIPGHLGLASAAVSALVSSKLMAFAIGASRSLLDLARRYGLPLYRSQPSRLSRIRPPRHWAKPP